MIILLARYLISVYNLCYENHANLPGNGGLLTDVAMMTAGWDDCPQKHAPGFPDNGKWVVKWENLKKSHNI